MSLGAKLNSADARPRPDDLTILSYYTLGYNYSRINKIDRYNSPKLMGSSASNLPA